MVTRSSGEFVASFCISAIWTRVKAMPRKTISGIGDNHTFEAGDNTCYFSLKKKHANLLQILKSYKLEPMGPRNIGMIYRMNRIADHKINIKFIDTNY